MSKISIKTLGCKVNQYESQLIRENFLKNGFEEVDGKKAADIYIINTCTVTSHADRESRRLIREAHHVNPNAKIVVTGCYVEKDTNEVSKIEGVTDIVKNSEKDRLPSLITCDLPLTTYNYITDFKDHTKAFVKIQDGCNNFCSFCKVPLVRGLPKSRPLNDIKKEVVILLDNGFKEIVLSGICLGEWGRDIDDSFELADVVEELQSLNKEFRIRLSSVELKYISDRLLKQMATSKKVCKHLHIPLQSGDNRILRMMNRSYTQDEYLDTIMKIKSFIPDIGITTDVLIGFPGEGEDHFDATLSLIEKCRPHRIHMFSYSRRQGTKAAELNGTVSPHIIKERMHKLDKVAKKLSYSYRRKFLNREVEVLIENKRDRVTQLLTGYTDTYIKVLLDGPDSLQCNLLEGKICRLTYDNTYIKIST